MNDKGFSLVEILIALVLLAVGLLAMAGMQVTSVRGNFFSRHLTQASYVAQDRLEFLNHLPFEAPQLQAGNYDDGDASASDMVFNRSYSVTINGGLKTIRYNVTWNDGTIRQVTISTIRAH